MSEEASGCAEEEIEPSCQAIILGSIFIEPLGDHHDEFACWALHCGTPDVGKGMTFLGGGHIFCVITNY